MKYTCMMLCVLLPMMAQAQRVTVAYGSDPLQAMDVYVPSPAPQHAPIIFMVHGGGWTKGDKAFGNVVRNKSAYWLKRGFVFISANNRLVPAANPLEQVNDIARAVAYAQQHAGQWGGDASRMVLMGHSAGGHIVAMLGAKPSVLAEAGAKPVRGIVALDGPYRITEIMRWPHWDLFDVAFGKDRALWEAASPYDQLSAGGPPFMLVCSTQRFYSCYQARRFAKLGSEKNVAMEVVEQDLSHSQINDQLGLDGDYTARVSAFVDGVLK